MITTIQSLRRAGVPLAAIETSDPALTMATGEAWTAAAPELLALLKRHMAGCTQNEARALWADTEKLIERIEPATVPAT